MTRKEINDEIKKIRQEIVDQTMLILSKTNGADPFMHGVIRANIKALKDKVKELKKTLSDTDLERIAKCNSLAELREKEEAEKWEKNKNIGSDTIMTRVAKLGKTSPKEPIKGEGHKRIPCHRYQKLLGFFIFIAPEHVGFISVQGYRNLKRYEISPELDKLISTFPPEKLEELEISAKNYATLKNVFYVAQARKKSNN